MDNYFSQSCNALTTGFDQSGIKNYAYSASVPGFSLTGSQPFTILATLSLRSVQSGAIFRQEGVFEMGIENGLLYIDAPGVCKIKYPKEIMSFAPDIWYTFAITFDGTKLCVYVDGLPATETECSAVAVASSDTCYEMGVGLEAYIRQVLLYPLALAAEEMHVGFLNSPVRTEECAAWFDFCGERVTERSNKEVPVSVKGFAKVVNICRILSAKSGIALYAPFEVLHPEEKGYTWMAKIYPHRTDNETMCIGANSDAERSSGWMLWLQKESDDVFRMCLRTGGAEGVTLTSEKTVNTHCWTDVAWTYDGTKITLYLDGEAAGTATGIAAGTLQGDGRTTFCGLTRRGKTDDKYAYSGYIAYVAEFEKQVSEEALGGYKTNQPYVLDEGVTEVFDFTDTNLTEKCTLQTFSVNGQAGIAWAENTNLLTDPQQIGFYMPEMNNAYWEDLSDELKWEVELYGLIVNTYLCNVLGYKLDAAYEKWYCSAAAYIVKNGLITPEFRQIVKEGPKVRQSTIHAFGAAMATGGSLAVIGGFIGTVCKKTSVRAAISSLFRALPFLAGVAAVAAVIGAAIGISMIVEHNKKRPNNKKVRILSIEFNHNSDPQTGGIHIRRDNVEAVVPPEWNEEQNNEANPACCAYIRGNGNFPPFIRVKVLFESDDPALEVMASLNAVENEPGILGGFNSDPFHLQANVAVYVDIPLAENHIDDDPNNLHFVEPVDGWWNWHCVLGDIEAVFVCNTYHRVYRLMRPPVNPWVFGIGQPYNPNEPNYPWMTAMDVAAAMCARGEGNIDDGLLGHLARGLNASENFTYDLGIHYFANFAFYIIQFQHDFNDFNDANHNIYLINCGDCAGVIGTYGNLHGENVKILHLSGINNNLLGFNYNPIIHIGRQQWGAGGFGYHRIVARCDNPQLVTDACLKIDIGPFPSQMPGKDIEKRPIVACDMLFSNQPDIDQVNVEEPFYEQVYRERFVRDGEFCSIFGEFINWFLTDGVLGSVRVETEMPEYYKRIGEYYGITTNVIASPEIPLVRVSSLRLDAVPDLVRIDKEHHYELAGPFSYKGKPIRISIQVCDSVTQAKTLLIYRLGDINYRHIPTAEERGIDLGEKAFVIQDDKGLNKCILLYRNNVVIYLTCATTEHVDLLPLACALDKQILEG